MDTDAARRERGAAASPGARTTEEQFFEFARETRNEFARLLMEHQFAVDEVLTKVSILRREFLHLHSYNPIEHVSSRVKTASSILEKLVRKGFEPSVESARRNLTDIAGVRIVCSFIADTYQVLETLTKQDDLTTVTIKDYIAHPKPNGYKSIHAIVQVPVFLTEGAVPMCVEVQIRTIAMDFWASLEHKIYYKYDGDVPPTLVTRLAETAAIAEQLDHQMEQMHTEIRGDSAHGDHTRHSAASALDEDMLQRMWSFARGIDADGR